MSGHGLDGNGAARAPVRPSARRGTVGNVSAEGMRTFWDARARENPWYFVDDRLDYSDPDVERFWAAGEQDLVVLLDRLGVELGGADVVVEIGCGLGRLTRALAARAGNVLALDVSPEMLCRARELNPELTNVQWMPGDGVSLAAIADGSADACLSHVVFQHIPDPAITLGYVAEMGRVLRPGGWAGFQISTDPAVHRPQRGRRTLVRRLAARIGRAPRGQRDAAWLGSPIDLAALHTTACDAGLSVESVQGAGTQFCLVLLRRRPPDPADAMPTDDPRSSIAR